MADDKIVAPSSLSVAGKNWWRKIHDECGADMTPSQLLQLQTGLEQLDTMKAAQALVKKEGLTALDRFGQAKPHPMLGVIKDCANGVRAMHKLLGLDLDFDDE